MGRADIGMSEEDDASGLSSEIVLGGVLSEGPEPGGVGSEMCDAFEPGSWTFVAKHRLGKVKARAFLEAALKYASITERLFERSQRM